MPRPIPQNPKEQYEYLVDQAEGYTRRRQLSENTTKLWRKRAMDWLKSNAPNSELSDALAIVPLRNLHRSLAVLLRARPVVPFLRDSPGIAPPKPDNAKKVFIVHGHHDALKNAVARVLTRIGLEPIILHELPNRGRTIIEKFMDHSDVGFAVVLLTADDRGGLSSENSDKFRKRARQNVIMELGFFSAV